MIIYCTNCILLWLLLEDSLQRLRVDILLHCVIEQGLTHASKRDPKHRWNPRSLSTAKATPVQHVVCSTCFSTLYMYIWKIQWFWWTTYTPSGMIRTSMNEGVPVVQAFVVSKPVSAFRQRVLSWKNVLLYGASAAFPYWFQASQQARSASPSPSCNMTSCQHELNIQVRVVLVQFWSSRDSCRYTICDNVHQVDNP